MVTSYDVIHAYKKAREEGAALEMYPSEDQKFMVDSKTGENICNLYHRLLAILSYVKIFLKQKREILHIR